jgi:CheY-like chemotaxis protein
MRIFLIDDNPAIHEDFHKILLPETPRLTELGELEAALFGGSAGDIPLPEAPTFDAELELDSAHQGEQAIALAAEAHRAGRPYQLAFVDLRITPGIDGIETIARLWQLDPRLQVVNVSAREVLAPNFLEVVTERPSRVRASSHTSWSWN